MAVVQVLAWKIVCGHPDGCPAALRSEASDWTLVRPAARERGWQADDETGRDRCPKHVGDPVVDEQQEPRLMGEREPATEPASADG